MEGYARPGLVFTIVLTPIFIAIALFIVAAILHVCCLIVGALSGSRAGFEGTFRVVAYSDSAYVANIIPVVGSLIGLVWWIVLAIMGVARLHRTTQGKAAAAVLIPVVACCGLGIILALIVGAALFSHFGRR